MFGLRHINSHFVLTLLTLDAFNAKGAFLRLCLAV